MKVWQPAKVISTGFITLLLSVSSPLFAQARLDLAGIDTPIVEVMQMISKSNNINIVLSRAVEGNVSFNLYDVTTDEAIRLIAEIGGYAVENRDGLYFILQQEELGKRSAGAATAIRVFDIQYAKPELMGTVLTNHLSQYGKITVVPDRKQLIVEDLADFLQRTETLLTALDSAPRQILIEAKILEITLDDNSSYGVNWTRFFPSDEGETKNLGTRGLASEISSGLFVDVVNENVSVFLEALQSEGKIRTLATPKLLTIEKQEASVIIGDRIGYRVTTTINQVTTESVEFLESGVILKVTASIDKDKNILLEISPQISTGTIVNNLPSQTTTEVRTSFITRDRQSVFIGGLIKNSTSINSSGVPVLRNIPLFGRLFGNKQESVNTSETIILITPYLVGKSSALSVEEKQKVEQFEQQLAQPK